MSLGKRLIEFVEAVLSWGVMPLLLSTGSRIPGIPQIPGKKFRVADTNLFRDEMAARDIPFDETIERKFEESVNCIFQGSRYKQASRILKDLLERYENLNHCSSLLVNIAVTYALRGKCEKALKYIEKAENEFRTLPVLFGESYDMLAELIIDTPAKIKAMGS